MTSPAPRASRPPIWAFLARIALAIAVFVVGALVALALLPDGSPDEVSTLLNRIVGGAGISMAVIATVVVLTRRVDRRPLREIGMTPPADAARFAAHSQRHRLRRNLTAVHPRDRGDPLRCRHHPDLSRHFLVPSALRRVDHPLA